MKYTPMPPIDYLRERFDLDEATGNLMRKSRSECCASFNARYANKPAGGLSNGYILVFINGHMFKSHRIVYFLATGTDPHGHVIDHIDGDRRNNRPSNLRIATVAENVANRKGARGDSSSSIRGVYLHKGTGKWAAEVRHNQIKHHLGLFQRIEDAAAAVMSARLQFFGAFAGGA